MIMFGGALSWFAAALVNTGVYVLAAIGLALASVPLAVVDHLLLAFPSGRLRGPAERWVAAAGYFAAVVLQVPLYALAPQGSPGGTLALADSPGLAAAGKWVQEAVGCAVLLAAAIIMAVRVRRAGPAQRRVLLPLGVYGIAAVLAAPLTADVIGPLTGMSVAAIAVVQVVVLGLVPVAFLAGMLRGGFARTGEIQELGAWLGTDAARWPSLEAALANALGDDSVRLAYWVPGQRAYADADGRPLVMPRPAPRARPPGSA